MDVVKINLQYTASGSHQLTDQGSHNKFVYNVQVHVCAIILRFLLAQQKHTVLHQSVVSQRLICTYMYDNPHNISDEEGKVYNPI